MRFFFLWVLNCIVYREHWPQEVCPRLLQASRVRDAYLQRYVAVQQFRFVDPFWVGFGLSNEPCDQIMFDKDDIIFSKVPNYNILELNRYVFI